jgi:hypothetical protein
MLEKEKAIEMFGVSNKHVHHFTMTTPEEHEVTGYISKSRESTMGSLIIDEVDGKQTLQYIQGMPKIHYLDERTELSTPNILEKSDGTNIVMAPLIVDGEHIETLFKTRGMPYCQEQWMEKIKQVITDNNYKAIEENNLSFSYELYGTDNHHETQYQFLNLPPLNYNLICVLEQGRALPYNEVVALSDHYKIGRLTEVFMQLKENLWALTPSYMDLYEDFLPKIERNCIQGNSLEEIYHLMEMFFEKMNMEFQNQNHGGIITEGAVWHYGENETHMLKNKALSVREGHIKQACGIPHEDILKAILKADENLDLDLDDRKNRAIVLEYVQEELLEEYSKKMVEDQKVAQKFHSILAKHVRKVTVTGEVQQIVDDIHKQIDVTADPADKMRIYSQFPDYNKKLTGKVYQALTKQQN